MIYARVYSPETGPEGTPAIIVADVISYRLTGYDIMSARHMNVIDGEYVSNLGQSDIHIEVLRNV